LTRFEPVKNSALWPRGPHGSVSPPPPLFRAGLHRPTAPASVAPVHSRRLVPSSPPLRASWDPPPLLFHVPEPGPPLPPFFSLCFDIGAAECPIAHFFLLHESAPPERSTPPSSLRSTIRPLTPPKPTVHRRFSTRRCRHSILSLSTTLSCSSLANDAHLHLPLHLQCCRALRRLSVSTRASLPMSKLLHATVFRHLIVTGLPQ
jgi:hypothetical protein